MSNADAEAFFREPPPSSFGGRAHPLVKLLASTSLQVTAFLLQVPLALAALLPLPLATFLLCRRLVTLAVLVVGFGILGAVWTLLAPPSQEKWYVENYGIVLALKGFVVFSAGLAVLFTTSTQQLIRSLRQLRLPALFVLDVVVMARYVPALFEEGRRIREGLILRMGHVGWRRRLSAPLTYLRALLVPLLVRAYARGDQLATVAEIRGFGQKNVSLLQRGPTIGWRDLVLLLITVGSITAGILINRS